MRVIVASIACLAAAGAFAAATGGAPARDAVLRPGVAIGEIRLGMTLGQVRAVLGRPSRLVHRERNGWTYTEYAWSSGWTVGFLLRAYTPPSGIRRVIAVATTRPERTRSGVGVGSTHRALQRTLGARCYRPPGPPYGPEELSGYPLQMLCYVGSRAAGGTRFRLANDCLIPTDRYILCPESKRRYVAYEVQVADSFAQRIRIMYEPTDWVRVR